MMANRKLRRLTRNHRGGEWNPVHHNALVRLRKAVEQLCGDEVHSWDVADPDTTDAYWAHCTLDAGHDTDHYDHHNHLRWSTERNFL